MQSDKLLSENHSTSEKVDVSLLNDYKICNQMMRRGALGCVMYALLWLLLSLSINLFHDNNLLAWSGLILFSVIGAFRSYLSLRFDLLFNRNPKQWLNLYSITAVSFAAVWGCLSAWIIWENLPSNPAAYLAGIGTAGFAAGGMAAYMSHRRLQLAHVVLTGLPPGIVSFSQGQPEPMMMGLYLLAGVGYLAFVGYQLNQQNFASLAANEVLRQHAISDGITGIANRRYFDERLRASCKEAAQQGKEMLLMLFDIDHFNQFNAHYGHEKGNQCLRMVAQTLNNQFTESGGLVARYSEDKIVVICDSSALDAVDIEATCALEAVMQCNLPHEASDVMPFVTVSAGVLIAKPASSTDSSVLMHKVSGLMREAKMRGRNRAVSYSYIDCSEGDIEPLVIINNKLQTAVT
ncbi:MAG: GGDEF domain-containing protein [Candidatus Sedimenticola sp. (ex Thyasira tokunagai)]